MFFINPFEYLFQFDFSVFIFSAFAFFGVMLLLQKIFGLR